MNDKHHEHQDGKQTTDGREQNAQPAPPSEPTDPTLEDLHNRIAEVLDNQSNRAVAEKLNMNTETVRRQRTDQRPQVQLLLGLLTEYHVNLNWLLSGKGQKFLSGHQREVLRELPHSELLRELGRRISASDSTVEKIRFDLEDLKAALNRAGLLSDEEAKLADGKTDN